MEVYGAQMVLACTSVPPEFQRSLLNQGSDMAVSGLPSDREFPCRHIDDGLRMTADVGEDEFANFFALLAHVIIVNILKIYCQQ